MLMATLPQGSQQSSFRRFADPIRNILSTLIDILAFHLALLNRL
jgi:hypothetical protein